MTNLASTRRDDAGFTLVEVLVALLVLSIGLLGVAALQTRSLRLSSDSFNLTQSQLLIDDLTERMRSNWNDGDALTSYQGQFAAADPTKCDMDSFGQTDAELKNELSCWLEQVNTTIGSDFAPTFTVFAAGNAKERYADIQLGWRDRELSSEQECDDFSDREWRVPAHATGTTPPDSTCFIVITWSVSL